MSCCQGLVLWSLGSSEWLWRHCSVVPSVLFLIAWWPNFKELTSRPPCNMAPWQFDRKICIQWQEVRAIGTINTTNHKYEHVSASTLIMISQGLGPFLTTSIYLNLSKDKMLINLRSHTQQQNMVASPVFESLKRLHSHTVCFAGFHLWLRQLTEMQFWVVCHLKVLDPVNFLH